MDGLTSNEVRLIKQDICPDCGLRLYEERRLREPKRDNTVIMGCVNGHKFNLLWLVVVERITPAPEEELVSSGVAREKELESEEVKGE